MTCASILSARPFARSRGARRRVAVLVVGALAVVGCGGDDDAESTTTLSATTLPMATTTLPPATTTSTSVAPTTTIAYVTEGATVLVANASGINGAAGRLTDRLASVGFTTAAATNSSAAVGQLSVTRILYVAGDDAAKAVADSLKEAFGGGDIEVAEAAIPVPTESGELGDATVLVLMGNDIADKSFAELQGAVTTTTEAADETTTTTG